MMPSARCARNTGLLLQIRRAEGGIEHAALAGSAVRGDCGSSCRPDLREQRCAIVEELMRLSLVAIVILGLPALAAGQAATPAPGSVPPLPPIGLPLPQIGLPHPPTGLPAAEKLPVGNVSHRPSPRARRPHRPGPALLPIFVYPSLYEPPSVGDTSKPPNDASARPLQPLVGRLIFDVTARGDEQLYIDGYFVGTLLDFASGVELEAGPHAVEIRMAGFETLSVAVNVAPGRTITYRGTLKAIDVRPDAPPVTLPLAAPTTPMIGYIVPGCYIGNVPPQDAGLPASCDLSRTITIKP